MVAGRGKRPFSLDQKVDNLDQYLPAGRRALEVRLLEAIRANEPALHTSDGRWKPFHGNADHHNVFTVLS